MRILEPNNKYSKDALLKKRAPFKCSFIKSIGEQFIFLVERREHIKLNQNL